MKAIANVLPKSIRWRLPLSYAAIALLAALSLGVVLLTALENYYARREQDYLRENAGAISMVAGQMLDNQTPSAMLKAQIESFSFLSQARIRLLDRARDTLIDSGIPFQDDPLFIQYLPEDAAYTPPDVTVRFENDVNYIWKIFLARSNESFKSGIAHNSHGPRAPRFLLSANLACPLFTGSALTCLSELRSSHPVLLNQSAPQEGLAIVSAFPTLYGFGLSGRSPFDLERSRQEVEVTVSDSAGSTLGYLLLSDGPAYGREILESVAGGWAIASAVAISLAAGVGWIVSQRISAPLIALTHVTARMADGDLSARADFRSNHDDRHDEFGLLARSFNDMAARIEETVTALRRFVADAAHELHTPITALHTNLELAASEDAGDRHRKVIERALMQLNRLETLADGLLQLSRIEAGVAEEKRKPVNPVQIVRETGEFYASQAEQAGIAFDLTLPETPVMVDASESQLRCAVGNLLENAIKFTPAGGTVRAGVRQDGKWIEIWVQDTGIGIPVEDLPLLFNRFHRGRNVSAYPGSGLGLAIVKAVAEKLGGEVTAANIPHGGSHFRLRLQRCA